MKTLRYVSIISAVMSVGIYLLLRYSPASHRYGWNLFGLELLSAGVGALGSVIALFKRSGWKYAVSLAPCVAILYFQLV